jgi:hypothetical protein
MTNEQIIETLEIGATYELRVTYRNSKTVVELVVIREIGKNIHKNRPNTIYVAYDSLEGKNYGATTPKQFVKIAKKVSR